jgi:transcriptional regulator with XRE-family HTH domain
VSEIEPSFDVASFYQALDGTRRARQLTWKDLAEQARIHASTLSRMSSGRRPDADSLALLSAWAGLNPADFVPGIERAQPEALAQLSAFIHSDPQLSPEAAAAFDELVKSTYVRLIKTSKADGE